MLAFIGTGSAFNTKLGNNSAFIKADQALLLIDCGGTVFDRLLAKGIFDDVKQVNVVITHLHPDHVGSLGDLIFYCYYMLKQPLTLISPLLEPLNTLLELMGVEREQYRGSLIATEMSVELTTKTITIKPVLTSHIDNLKAYGYLLTVDGQVVYYSGDSRSIPREILDGLRAGSIHRIYQDTCGAEYPGNVHLPLSLLQELIPENLRNKVWCMHLDTLFDPDIAGKLGFNVVQAI